VRGDDHAPAVTGALAFVCARFDSVSMKKRTVSLEDIDDRGKLRDEPLEEAVAREKQATEESGEETATGSNPTPDQDVIEEIGEAMGVTYSDEEELRLGRKEAERDEHRWELDPASSEDYAQRVHPRGEGPAETVRHMKHHHRGEKP